MKKKTERIKILAREIKVGDIIQSMKHKNTPALGWVVDDVRYGGDGVFLSVRKPVLPASPSLYMHSDNIVTVDRTVESLDTEDRVYISKNVRVVAEVDQEGLELVAEGELVKIYLGDKMAILARSEWDQIVNAL